MVQGRAPFKKSGTHGSAASKGSSSSRVGMKPRKGGMFAKRKVCRFCAEKMEIDYKNINLIRSFMSDKGKIVSGRVTGVCAKHQRRLATAIKRARMLALLPFTVE